jgi:formate hydrogenlyase subunit 4
MEWAAGMKLFLFLALLANLFFPWGVAPTLMLVPVTISLGALVLKIGILSASVAILETCIAKLRLFRVPELLSGSFTLALLAVISFFFVR